MILEGNSEIKQLISFVDKHADIIRTQNLLKDDPETANSLVEAYQVVLKFLENYDFPNIEIEKNEEDDLTNNLLELYTRMQKIIKEKQKSESSIGNGFSLLFQYIKK